MPTPRATIRAPRISAPVVRIVVSELAALTRFISLRIILDRTAPGPPPPLGPVPGAAPPAARPVNLLPVDGGAGRDGGRPGGHLFCAGREGVDLFRISHRFIFGRLSFWPPISNRLPPPPPVVAPP